MTLDIDKHELDLLHCALELWAERIDAEAARSGPPQGHVYCARFTRPRIIALMKRLELPQPTGERE